MKLLGYEITVKKALNNIGPSLGGGWWPLIRESFPGAWQRNVEVKLDDVLSYWAVFRCISIISSDISKLGLHLQQKNEAGIWQETESAAFSPVLRKPNRYQNRVQFFASWMESKLTHGNTYVLKQRNDRGNVAAMYILHPWRVRPLVSDDGSVFYQLNKDNLSNLEDDEAVVPASEIIHDRWNTIFHPLWGLSPIYAVGITAMTGLSINKDSANFFSNGAIPSGVLTAPGAINNETAERLKRNWQQNFGGNKKGEVAVLGDGLKYDKMQMSSVDAQLIEQQKWTVDAVCGAYGVPSYMVNAGAPPTYNNVQALTQQYYSQCLQVLIEAIEIALDEGLALPKKFRTDFDLDDLLRMDTATMVDASTKSIKGGIMTPNEARRKFDLGAKAGGDAVYLQQQDHSLEALAARDKRLIEQGEQPLPQQLPPQPPPESGTDDEDAEDDDMTDDQAQSFAAAIEQRLAA